MIHNSFKTFSSHHRFHLFFVWNKVAPQPAAGESIQNSFHSHCLMSFYLSETYTSDYQFFKEM
jgi:hypothetical protein